MNSSNNYIYNNEQWNAKSPKLLSALKNQQEWNECFKYRRGMLDAAVNPSDYNVALKCQLYNDNTSSNIIEGMIYNRNLCNNTNNSETNNLSHGVPPPGTDVSGASTSGAFTSGASTSGAFTSGASTSGAFTSGASTSGAYDSECMDKDSSCLANLNENSSNISSNIIPPTPSSSWSIKDTQDIYTTALENKQHVLNNNCQMLDLINENKKNSQELKQLNYAMATADGEKADSDLVIKKYTIMYFIFLIITVSLVILVIKSVRKDSMTRFDTIAILIFVAFVLLKLLFLIKKI